MLKFYLNNMSASADRLIVPGEGVLNSGNGFSSEHPFGLPYEISHRSIEVTEKERELSPQTFEVFLTHIDRLPPWCITPDGKILYSIKTLKAAPMIVDVDGQDPIEPRIVYDGVFDLNTLNDEAISDELASVIRLFKFTEDFLPDYTREMARVGRNYHGLSLSGYQWSNEEGDHGIALGEILTRTRRRNSKDEQRDAVGELPHHNTREELEQLYLDQQKKTLEMPFENVEEFLGFGVLQEPFAYVHYEKAAKKADSEGAQGTAFVLRLIGAVEAYHAKGYRVMIGVFAKYDPDTMKRAILRNGANFKWPAEHLLSLRGKAEALRNGPKVGMLSGDSYREQIYSTLRSFRGLISPAEAAAAADVCMRKKAA